MNFELLTAVWLDTGYANVYFEKNVNCCDDKFAASTEWSSGGRSIGRTSSGPKSHSGILTSSGETCKLLIR